MTRAEVLRSMRGPKYPLEVRLNQLIYDAHMMGLEQIEINSSKLTDKIIEELTKSGYGVLRFGNNITIKW